MGFVIKKGHDGSGGYLCGFYPNGAPECKVRKNKLGEFVVVTSYRDVIRFSQKEAISFDKREDAFNYLRYIYDEMLNPENVSRWCSVDMYAQAELLVMHKDLNVYEHFEWGSGVDELA